MSRRLSFVAIGVLAFVSGILSRPAFSNLKGKVTSIVAENTAATPLDMLGYTRKSSQFAELRQSRKIVMLGDSRVEHGQWAELFERCDISNRGISGDTTQGIVERLSSSVPGDDVLCVIQAGINDLNKGSSIGIVVANFRKILQYLQQEQRARVIVTSVIFAGQDQARLNARVAECNEALRQLCVETGSVWLDLNIALSPHGSLAPEYSNDGVHLNGQGYLRWRDLLRPALESENS